MANTKVTGLSENTDPQQTDILYIVDDPGGSPASEKVTIANIKAAVNDVSTDTLWNSAGDILYATGDNAGTVLPIGSNNYVLTSDGTVPSWQAASGGVGASGVVVAGTVTTSGASPHSVSTTGYQEDDIALWVMTTRNSAIDTDGPEGGGWTKLWLEDTATDEEVSAWYKVCSNSEGTAWTWEHSAGDLAVSAMLLYRNLSGSLIHYGVNKTRTCPVVQGSSNGVHFVVAQCCYEATSIAMTDTTSLLTIDINTDNNDQAIIVAHRDAQFPAAQVTFSFTGGNSGYVACGAFVIE